MKDRFDFQTYLLRHGATICKECSGEGVLDVSIGPPWRAEKLEDCPVCNGRGLHLDELRRFHRVRQVAVRAA